MIISKINWSLVYELVVNDGTVSVLSASSGSGECGFSCTPRLMGFFFLNVLPPCRFLFMTWQKAWGIFCVIYLLALCLISPSIFLFLHLVHISMTTTDQTSSGQTLYHLNYLYTYIFILLSLLFPKLCPPSYIGGWKTSLPASCLL